MCYIIHYLGYTEHSNTYQNVLMFLTLGEIKCKYSLFETHRLRFNAAIINVFITDGLRIFGCKHCRASVMNAELEGWTW